MKIQLKRSNTLDSGSAKEPTAGQMEYGELAVNYNDNDPAVFLKDSSNNIIRIAGLGSVGSGTIPSGDSLPSGQEPGSVFFNTSDDTLYYWNGASWVAINGDDAYVDVSGDNMTGNLTLGTDKITLNATSGNASFAGKITSAATVAGDPSTTVVTKGYVDSSGTVAGDGLLTIKTSGEGASSTGTFTANQSGNSDLTLPTIRYQDLSGTPSVPAAPGSGTLNIKDSTGTSLGTFNANATTGTETVISLPGGVAPTEPGAGALTIKNFNDSSSASGSFNANQSSGSTITLKQINYSDLSGKPSIPSAANNGRITIKQPGTSDQTFTVNQSGNTTVTLKNDNTQNTPGSGSLIIKNYNDNSSASGSFNANQSGNGTITLKQIKYSDISGTPAASGGTDLGNSTTSTTVKVTSSTGTDTTIAAASGSKAGVMTSSQVSDLSTAKSTANSANSAASSAQQTANTAKSTADTAKSTADTALSQSIKAWARTNSGGSVRSGNNLNCSLGGAGFFNYTFKNGLGTANYAAVVSLSEGASTGNFAMARIDNATSSGFNVITWYQTGAGQAGASYEHSVMIIAL